MAKNIFLCICLVLLSCPGMVLSKEDNASSDSRAWRTLQMKVQSSLSDSESLKELREFIRRYPNGEHASDARFAIAEILFQKSQYAIAKPQYELMAAEKDSTYGDDSMLRLGEICYNTGDKKCAREQWDKLADKFFGESAMVAEAMYGIILCDLHEKDYLSAKQRLEKLVKNYPFYSGLAKINEIYGLIYFQEKEFEKAVDVLEDVNTPAAAFYRGLSFFHLKRYLEAAESFKKLTIITSGTYAELGAYFKAESFRAGKNNTLAAQAYAQFIEQYPKSNLKPYAYVQLGQSLYQLNRMAEAEKVIAVVKQMKISRDIKIYAMYIEGELAAKKGDFKSAVAVLDLARRIVNSVDQPDLYAIVMTAKGYYLLKMGEFKAAADVMSELIHTMPYHPLGVPACMILGNAAYERKDWSQAISAYETALLKYKYSVLSDVAMAMLLRTYYAAEKYQELVTNANRVMKVINAEFPAQDTQWRTYGYYVLAEAYYMIKQYADASNYYLKSMKHPYWVQEARLCLAWSRYHEEKYPEAIALAKQVMADPNILPERKSSAYFLMAASYFNQKNYSAAIDGFNTFRRHFPKDERVAESYLQEGLACKQAKYFKDALAAWEKLIALYPNNPAAQDAQMQAGKLHFEGRQYKTAVAMFVKFLQKWPQSPQAPEAQWLTAQAYYNDRQYDPAIKTYQLFLESYPKDFRVEDGKNQLMMSYYHRAMRSKTPEHLAEFVELYPKNDLAADAQYQLGQIAYTKKDWPAAVRELRKLLLNYPGNAQSPMALLAIAHAQEYMKNLDGAIPEYESLLNLFPSSSFALDAAMRLGAIYYNREKYKDAAKKFQFAAEREAPKQVRADAAFNTAVSYKMAQSYGDAIHAYESFISNYDDDPRHFDALLDIAGIYKLKEEHLKAVEIYNKILESKNTKMTAVMKMEMYRQIGEIYLKSLNNKEKAMVAYSQLVPLVPQKHDIRLLGLAELAALYEEREDWLRALDIYKHIQASGGRKDWVASAVERAKDIQKYMRAKRAKAAAGSSGASAAPQTQSDSKKKKSADKEADHADKQIQADVALEKIGAPKK